MLLEPKTIGIRNGSQNSLFQSKEMKEFVAFLSVICDTCMTKSKSNTYSKEFRNQGFGYRRSLHFLKLIYLRLTYNMREGKLK